MQKLPQKNHTFQIRFAETGYPQTYENIPSISTLMQNILKDYKIEITNQKIISKNGMLLDGTSVIDDQNLLKKTFSQNPNNPKQMLETACVYLFNHKQLLRNSTQSNNTNEQILQSKAILQKQHQTCIGLRHKIFELKPLQQKFSKDKILKLNDYNPTLLEMAKLWLEHTENFVNIMTLYKENEYCIDEYIERWENQRKGLITLMRNLKLSCQDRQKCIQKMKNNIEAFKQTYDEVQKQGAELSLPKTPTTETLIKNISEKSTSITKKINNIEYQLKINYNKYRQLKNTIANIHNQLEKRLKEIDTLGNKKYKHLNEISNEMKQNYVVLTDGFREMIEIGDDAKVLTMLNKKQNIQEKYQQYTKIGYQYVEQSQELFVELYRMSKSHEQMVRLQYKKYNQLHTDIQENLRKNCQHIQTQIYQMCKFFHELQQLYKQNSIKLAQDHQKIKLIKQLQEIQLRRRQYFNMKLLGIQQQVKEILREEESQRINFFTEVIGQEQQYDNTLLANIRVPCFLLNFDQTTDNDLPFEGGGTNGKNALKNSLHLQQNSHYLMNLQFYRSSSGMDRVLQELQAIKNCQVVLKKDEIATQSKIKTIQLILQKSSDIFHHIYMQKLATLTKQNQHKQNAFVTKINTLTLENNALRDEKQKYEQTKNFHQEQKLCFSNKSSLLQNQVNLLQTEKLHLQNKIKQLLQQQSTKYHQYNLTIEENKKDLAKLKKQKKQIQDSLGQEVKNTLQTLLMELEKSTNRTKQLQELNRQYKNVMGDQQVKIINLEAQLKINKDSDDNDAMTNSMKLKQSFYGEHLQIQPKPKNEDHLHPNDKTEQQDKIQSKQGQNSELQVELIQPKLPKKDIKSITNQEIKQIQRQIFKLEKQIEQLKQDNQQLKIQNNSLNQQILKIAMKDTEDQQIQTDPIQKDESIHQLQLNKVENNQKDNTFKQQINQLNLTEYIKLQDNPHVGQLRLFMPFCSGLYVAVKSNKSFSQPIQTHSALSTLNRNIILQSQPIFYDQSTWPFVIDLNCLSVKARQLLTECTLVIVMRVTKVLPGSDKFYVQGQIISAIGFQDEDLRTKDYGPLLKN